MYHAPNVECLYFGHLDDTAEHTRFDYPNWEASRSEVKTIVGGKNIAPGDIQDVLCGPADLPSLKTDSDGYDPSAAHGVSIEC